VKWCWLILAAALLLACTDGLSDLEQDGEPDMPPTSIFTIEWTEASIEDRAVEFVYTFGRDWIEGGWYPSCEVMDQRESKALVFCDMEDRLMDRIKDDAIMLVVYKNGDVSLSTGKLCPDFDPELGRPPSC